MLDFSTTKERIEEECRTIQYHIHQIEGLGLDDDDLYYHLREIELTKESIWDEVNLSFWDKLNYCLYWIWH